MVDPPGREAAIVAAVKQTQRVAGGIAKPRFAPAPALVCGLRIKDDAMGSERGDGLVQSIQFEIGDGRGCADLLHHMDRESLPGWRFKPGIARRGVDDLSQAERGVECH
ncbi:hypothetical protein A8B75_16485 [Sphingomonadales bacterium EhC05]|nr:hypothetical protein A8B75_16485 [Sphingomonadales bacterium EhC05]